MECFYSSNYKLELSKHKRKVHEEELNFQCNNCNKETFSKAELKYHFVSKHKEEECKILRIGCKQCEERQEHHCAKKIPTA